MGVLHFRKGGHMVYFKANNGKFTKLYGIVACDYYVESNTLICYEDTGIRWIFIGANGIKVTENIVFNVHNGRNA